MATDSRAARALTSAPTRSAGWTEHLGTALTLGYLALIAVGMFHNVLRITSTETASGLSTIRPRMIHQLDSTAAR